MHNPQFAIGVIRKQGMRLYLVIGKNWDCHFDPFRFGVYQNPRPIAKISR